MGKAEAKPKKRLEDEFKIINVRLDGTEQESMDGVEVTVNEHTIVAYRLIANAILNS